ncbi:MAG TPA: PLP-dependent aspartate aminotransferase family protein [Gemmatimonadaceae bacterium]|nr:PLP-dependent aspartate aminotransferase family protein [Gemmatimonadaceae bacterium]
MAHDVRTLGPSTIAVHGGPDGRHAGGAVAAPLFQSVNFEQEVGTGEGLRYARYGNNPNAESVQRRLAMLEGAEAALVLSSGMGATACALLALLRPGDHLISSSWIYGGTHKLLTAEFGSIGIDVTFIDPMDSRGFRRAIRKKTRAIFIESPVNPTCRVVDMRPLAQLASEHGLAFAIDSTFASPVNFRPLEHGADVVIHSATKFLNGHSDVLAGAVIGTASYVEEVRQKMIVWGQAPDPFACWLLERGLKTLAVRVRQACANAMAVAQWCAEHPAFTRVHYPGLSSHPEHELATRTLEHYGSMLGVELAGGGPGAEAFLRKLEVITHAPSLGGVESLASEPRFTSHAGLSPAERERMGIPDGFVRLSIGIEDAADLIADIEQALS